MTINKPRNQSYCGILNGIRLEYDSITITPTPLHSSHSAEQKTELNSGCAIFTYEVRLYTRTY